MGIKDEQITFEEINPEYAAFVEKFKPKKTTDDCYTPENVYDVIADWVSQEYMVDRSCFVRPFWPGADYQKFDYNDGCIVVDNPPFSIRTEILKFYMARNIRFFLFSPSLTLLSPHLELCYIVTDADITYENGAVVRTAFITNLEDCLLRTAPDLMRKIQEANDKNTKKPELPTYNYPDNIVTAAMLQRWCHAGIEYKLSKKDACFISAMDSQKTHGKTIFGSGLLLSDSAAAERAAAERAAKKRVITWELSNREKKIIEFLNERGKEI